MRKSTKKGELFLVCQNIRSLFNVGAIFRTADVFGVSKIYLTGYTGKPPHQEISKTALGAESWISWEYQRQTLRLLKQLKKDGVSIVALEIHRRGISLPNFKSKFPSALVVGNEVLGVTKPVLKLADTIVRIPMLGKKESLNVAVATGIALYGIRYQK